MAYRLFRLYFNDNADNFNLFGNRVHNPLNADQTNSQLPAAIVRIILIIGALVAIIGITAL